MCAAPGEFTDFNPSHEDHPKDGADGGALQKADDGHFLLSLAETPLRFLMEPDTEGVLGGSSPLLQALQDGAAHAHRVLERAQRLAMPLVLGSGPIICR